MTAVARDAAGNVTPAAAVPVTVDNASPTVSLTSPSSGATLSGTVTVTASASDNVGVVGVQFRLDGVALGGEDTAAPYAIAWDTTTVINGSHTLTAVVRDGAGNITTSVAVTVSVANSTGGTVIRIDETSSAIAYSGPWIQGNTGRAWSGGTAALGFGVGQRATLSFSGTAVSWIGWRSSQTGIANVYLDGILVATVDAYASDGNSGGCALHGQRTRVGATYAGDRGDADEE